MERETHIMRIKGEILAFFYIHQLRRSTYASGY